MIVIPAIDLFDGKCVRLTQGCRSKVSVYDAGPVEVAQRFEAAGARMLHLVNLNGAFQDRHLINLDVAKRMMRSLDIPVQYGGGLRSATDIADILGAGASQVIVSTIAVRSPALLEECVKLFGSRVAVGIAERDGRVAISGWEEETSLGVMDLAHRVAAVGVERILYTDIARDGTLAGINIDETCALARESGLKVTAVGGVKSLDDIARIRGAESAGVDSVIVGRALYEGIFTLQQASEVANNGIP